MSLAPANWLARLWARLRRRPPAGGYPLFVALMLNLDRAWLQEAIAVGKGVASFHDPADLGVEWADAAARDPAEIDAILGASQQQRASARSKRRGR